MHVQPEAQAAWSANERILEDIIAGKTFNQDEFVRAVDFFGELTGIQSQDEGTDIGRVPNEHLREDLDRWRAWYAANAPRLRWDAGTGRVMVERDVQPQ